jgi:hypothetical protein
MIHEADSLLCAYGRRGGGGISCYRHFSGRMKRDNEDEACGKSVTKNRDFKTVHRRSLLETGASNRNLTSKARENARIVSSGALLAGVVEQSLRDVLPDRVAAI